MYDSILVPTDGSEQAFAAVEEALELAALCDATVHILYVVEPIPLGGFAAGMEPSQKSWGEVIDEQKAEGAEAISTITTQAADYDLIVQEAIRHGKPTESILEYVEEADIDAIAMGTHGRSGAGRFIIGSVAEKVVRQSPVPVLTVRIAEIER